MKVIDLVNILLGSRFSKHEFNKMMDKPIVVYTTGWDEKQDTTEIKEVIEYENEVIIILE